MEPWLERTLPQLLDEQARKWPDQEAAVIDGRRLTYGQLAQESARIARRLVATGVRPGNHVAVLMEASEEFLLLHYAIARIGAILVPVNFNFRSAELDYVLRQADCSHLFFAERVGEQDFWTDLAVLTGGYPSAAPGVLESDRFPSLRTMVCLSRAEPRPGFEAVLDYDAFMRGDNPERAAEVAGYQAGIAPGDVCYMLLTSGSTGFPKLAQVTHRSLVGVAHYYNRCLRVAPGDKILAPFTLYHIGGLGFGVANALSAAACLVTSRTFAPEEILETMARERVTVAGFFDTHVTRIMSAASFADADLSTLKSALFGGTPSTFERLHHDWGIPLVTPNFASTETGASISLVDADVADEAVRRTTNGRPLPGITVRVVDPETGLVVPAGRAGELRVKGWSVFKGYYNMPEQNAEAFDAEGYFRTGDIGYLDESGNVHYAGRYKMMVRTGGENVSEIEVENFLAELVPGLRAVRVVGVPDPSWGEAVTAFIELEPGVEAMSLDELRALCKRTVASYKIPRNVFYLRSEQWPVNASGKVSKPDLRQMAASAAADPSMQGSACYSN